MDAEYRVTTVIPLTGNPVRNVCLLNQDGLYVLLEGYDEYGEFLVGMEKIEITGVILFGSARAGTDASDIDIGVTGLAPELFFDFCWELYRDLSKPLDVIDLSKDCLFNRPVKRDGVVLCGR